MTNVMNTIISILKDMHMDFDVKDGNRIAFGVTTALPENPGKVVGINIKEMSSFTHDSTVRFRATYVDPDTSYFWPCPKEHRIKIISLLNKFNSESTMPLSWGVDLRDGEMIMLSWLSASHITDVSPDEAKANLALMLGTVCSIMKITSFIIRDCMARKDMDNVNFTAYARDEMTRLAAVLGIDPDKLKTDKEADDDKGRA